MTSTIFQNCLAVIVFNVFVDSNQKLTTIDILEFVVFIFKKNNQFLIANRIIFDFFFWRISNVCSTTFEVRLSQQLTRNMFLLPFFVEKHLFLCHHDLREYLSDLFLLGICPFQVADNAFFYLTIHSNIQNDFFVFTF